MLDVMFTPTLLKFPSSQRLILALMKCKRKALLCRKVIYLRREIVNNDKLL